jgi:hypothetical protein
MPRTIPFSFCSTVTLVAQPGRLTDIPYLWRERLQEGFAGTCCSGTSQNGSSYFGGINGIDYRGKFVIYHPNRMPKAQAARRPRR